MIMTEEEAARKWCPHVRARVTYSVGNGEVIGVASANRFGSNYNPEICSCIARVCAAWRVHPYREGSGYCGLAGVPLELQLALAKESRP